MKMNLSKLCVEVMQKPHQTNIPVVHNFPYTQDWIVALDKDLNIPNIDPK